jgi:PAS domain S-box-containing protein
MLGAFALFARQYEQKRQYLTLYQTEAELRAITERHSVTLKSIGDAVIVTDAQGHVELLNSVAEKLTGWSDDEAHGRPLEEVFHIINEHSRAPVENPAVKVAREGMVVGLANHTLLMDKNGTERPIADSGAPIFNAAGRDHRCGAGVSGSKRGASLSK